MDLNPSDVIAGVALLVSLASVHYTKKQSDSADASNQNSYRAYLSENHGRYRTLLRDVDQKHKDALRRLSSEAADALGNVVEIFDQFTVPETESDRSGGYVRPLRHLIDEAAEMLFYAFNGQMGWQTGLNITMRLAQMRNMEERLRPDKFFKTTGDFRRDYSHTYFSDKNGYQEQRLLRDPHFCGLVTELKERIDRNRSAELLLAIEAAVAPFKKNLASLRLEIAPSLAQLRDALDESELDHFSLMESPLLLQRLRTMTAKLDVLSNLYLQDISDEHARHYRNYVAMAICAGATLYAVQSHHDWGWPEANGRTR